MRNHATGAPSHEMGGIEVLGKRSVIGMMPLRLKDIFVYYLIDPKNSTFLSYLFPLLNFFLKVSYFHS